MTDRACFARHMGAYLIVPRCRDFDFAATVEAIRVGIIRPKAEALPKDDARAYDVRADGTVVLALHGVMMKGFSKFADADTLAMRSALREARADRAVRGVMLHVDSPGGSVAGTQELAEDMAALSAAKPTRAYIEDLGASAAYWVASQARGVSVNAAGEVGSIGAVALVRDYSEAARMDGIKVHVVSTGPHKGLGAPGTPITEEYLADWQERIDADGARFFAAVSKARGLEGEALAAVTDGRVFQSGKALELGLVDRVETFDEALAGLRGEIEAEDRAARTGRRLDSMRAEQRIGAARRPG